MIFDDGICLFECALPNKSLKLRTSSNNLSREIPFTLIKLLNVLNRPLLGNWPSDYMEIRHSSFPNINGVQYTLNSCKVIISC